MIADLLERFGDAAPTELRIHFDEEAASAAFKAHTIGVDAAKENAAIGRIERKEVGAAEEILAFRIFFFESFGVLAKETVRVFGLVKAEARDEEEPFVLCVFEEDVAVTRPRGRKRGSAVFVEKLLEDFIPAELAKDVFINLFPLRTERFGDGGQLDVHGLLV